MTIRGAVTAVLCLGAAWLGVLLAVTRLSSAAPAYVVLFPSTDFVAQLAPDIAVTQVNRFSVTVSSSATALPDALFAAGAALVLPAGLEACVPTATQ